MVKVMEITQKSKIFYYINLLLEHDPQGMVGEEALNNH